MKEYEGDKPAVTDAVNEVTKTSRLSPTDPHWIVEVGNEFIQQKWLRLPQLAQEFRRVNHLKRKHLGDVGNEGGWSETKNFKFDYSIPKELYLFMVNMVYDKFWDEENEKVWRWFLDQLMSGEDLGTLIRKIRMHYDGSEGKLKFKD